MKLEYPIEYGYYRINGTKKILVFDNGKFYKSVKDVRKRYDKFRKTA